MKIVWIITVSLLIYGLIVAPLKASNASIAKKRHSVVRIAKRYIGTPYIWGASSPRGFDCSGLVKYVYAKIHIYLPHYTYSMYRYGRYVSKKNLLPGDLVFFGNLSHMGMYIGNGRFIHAPHSGAYVTISLLRDRSNYYGARRIL